ncbi:uncharacterized protein LOC144612298 [Rhinoraja longicauda]
MFSSWFNYIMNGFRNPQDCGPGDRCEGEGTAHDDNEEDKPGASNGQHNTTPAAVIRDLESGGIAAGGDEVKLPQEVAGPSKAMAEGQPDKGSLSFGVHYPVAELRWMREGKEHSAEAILQPGKQGDSEEQLAGTMPDTDTTTVGESSVESAPLPRPVDDSSITLEYPKRKPAIFHRPTPKRTVVLKETVRQSIRLQSIAIGFSTWRPGSITSIYKHERSWGMEKLRIQKTFSLAANMY